MTALTEDEVLTLAEAYQSGTDSLKQLAERFGLTLYSLRRLAHLQGWVRTRRAISARPTSWINKPCPGLAECPERSETVAQAWALAQRQIDDIELQFAEREEGDDFKPAHAVAHARAIGVMVRVLKDLVALDRAARSDAPANDEQGGFDSDGLRDELARRLVAIRERGNAEGSPRESQSGNA